MHFNSLFYSFSIKAPLITDESEWIQWNGMDPNDTTLFAFVQNEAEKGTWEVK